MFLSTKCKRPSRRPDRSHCPPVWPCLVRIVGFSRFPMLHVVVDVAVAAAAHAAAGSKVRCPYADNPKAICSSLADYGKIARCFPCVGFLLKFFQLRPGLSFVFFYFSPHCITHPKKILRDNKSKSVGFIQNMDTNMRYKWPIGQTDNTIFFLFLEIFFRI